MHSDAIDQLLTTYLKQPAKVSWQGALGDSVRGNFEGARLELAGVSVLAMERLRELLTDYITDIRENASHDWCEHATLDELVSKSAWND